VAKFFGILDKIQEYIIIVLVGFCIIVGTAQVACRFIFSYALPWSEEVIRYCFVWIVFIAAALAVRDEQHATITVFTDYLPKKIQECVKIIASVCAIAFSYFITVQGFNLVQQQIAGNQLTPAMEIPIAVVTVSIPIGAILMALYYVRNIVNSCQQLAKKEVPATPEGGRE